MIRRDQGTFMIEFSVAGMLGSSGPNIFNMSKRVKMRKVLDVVGWLLVLLLLFVGLSSLFGRVGFLNNEFSKEVTNIGEGLYDFGFRYIQHYFLLVFTFSCLSGCQKQIVRSDRKDRNNSGNNKRKTI